MLENSQQKKINYFKVGETLKHESIWLHVRDFSEPARATS